MTNTKKNEKEFNLNHQQQIRRNLLLLNYLDQIREQERIKQIGVKKQKQQQPDLLLLHDLLDINYNDKKQWKN